MSLSDSRDFLESLNDPYLIHTNKNKMSSSLSPWESECGALSPYLRAVGTFTTQHFSNCPYFALLPALVSLCDGWGLATHIFLTIIITLEFVKVPDSQLYHSFLIYIHLFLFRLKGSWI